MESSQMESAESAEFAETVEGQLEGILVDTLEEISDEIAVDENIDRVSTPVPTSVDQLEGILFLHRSSDDKDEEIIIQEDVPDIPLISRPASPIDNDFERRIGLSKEDEVKKEKILNDLKEMMKNKDGNLALKSRLEYLAVSEIRRTKTIATKDDSERPKTEDEVEREYAAHLQRYLDKVEKYGLANENERKLKSELEQQVVAIRSRVEEEMKEIIRKRSRVILNAKYEKSGHKMEKNKYDLFKSHEMQQYQQLLHLLIEVDLISSKIRKADERLKQREKIADGLHLIDFEQIKIENQSLQDKIEDRSTELQKLRSKILKMVHQISHYQEKLEFLLDRNKSTVDKNISIDARISELKDMVPKLKKERDETRKSMATMKLRAGFLVSKDLLKDYEEKSVRLKHLQKEVNGLQEIFNQSSKSRSATARNQNVKKTKTTVEYTTNMEVHGYKK